MTVRLECYRETSEEEIQQAERQLGVTFAEDYREFASKYDGATPEENIFEDDVNVSVDRFVPISDLVGRASSIEGFPEDGWPIAEAPGGNFVYMRKGDSSVFYWNHEIESGH